MICPFIFVLRVVNGASKNACLYANDKLDYVNAPSTNDQFTDQRDFTIEDIPAKNIDQQIEIQELDLALEDDLNRLMQRVKYERCFLEM